MSLIRRLFLPLRLPFSLVFFFPPLMFVHCPTDEWRSVRVRQPKTGYQCLRNPNEQRLVLHRLICRAAELDCSWCQLSHRHLLRASSMELASFSAIRHSQHGSLQHPSEQSPRRLPPHVHQQQLEHCPEHRQLARTTRDLSVLASFHRVFR